MSNKTRLQANNETIQNLINKANSLPNAGSGGGGSGGGNETITITYTEMPEPDMEIIYLDETMTFRQEAVVKNGSYTILKGTLLAILQCMVSPSSALTQVGGDYDCRLFLATGHSIGGGE